MSREQVQSTSLIKRIEQKQQEEENKRRRHEESQRQAKEALRKQEVQFQNAKRCLLAEAMRLSCPGSAWGDLTLSELESPNVSLQDADLSAAIQCLQQKAAETSEELNQAIQSAQGLKRNIEESLEPALPA